jgi:hypothetical protein
MEEILVLVCVTMGLTTSGALTMALTQQMSSTRLSRRFSPTTATDADGLQTISEAVVV